MALEYYLNPAKYQELYNLSISKPDEFWSQQAQQFISWDKTWDTVSDCDFKTGKINWYNGAKLNASFNCLDRHVQNNPNKTAILWEGNTPGESKELTYKQLLEQVCKFANVLLSLGVKAGDRVCIYMPLVPEIVIAMLACARIGAVHSVVFAGFSAEALRTRITDCGSKIVITANESLRGDKTIDLKASVDEAIAELASVAHVIVVERTTKTVNWHANRDHSYTELMAKASTECAYYVADSADPLFVLYTSGSTGKPKGVLHTTGGYLTYAAITFHYIFDYHSEEIYWCTADAGWITGHTYLVYGPLLNAATILMYEGVPAYPDASRLWQIIDKYKVNIFYTAPTLIRALMAHGDDYLNTTGRDSLRILGSVGEPINPAAWEWYYNKIGNGKCPIVDTWWQTETGGIMITPLPGVSKLKPGSALQPFFGIKPVILNEQGQLLNDNSEGYLAISSSWPGQMHTIYGDKQRFIDNYFAQYPGYYFAGDAAKRDADGDYWIIGRVDDVLKISGHRIGTAEVESALVKDHNVAEAAVVGIPDEITGESIYAFVQLMDGVQGSKNLEQELINLVKKEVGGFAAPKTIHFTSELPKTRSGKIMRRILRKIACGETADLGDISTLGNPEAVKMLLNKPDIKS